MSDYIENEIKILPMLPLRGLSVFPGMLLSFDVERNASVAALDAAVKADHLIFLSAQKDIAVDVPDETDIYHVGTIAAIKQVIKLPGDNIRLLVEGKSRASLRAVTQEDPHHQRGHKISRGQKARSAGGSQGRDLSSQDRVRP